MTGSLAGKGCLVTGAAGGIGRAIAEALVREGARVVGLDLTEMLDEAGETAFDLRACDVTDRDAVLREVERAADRLGALDVTVTAAALTGGSGPFETLSDDDWDRYLRVNLSGTFLVCRAAARRMIADGTAGSLITIGSVNSFAAEPGAAPYVASKGGVALLTKAMAVDLARYRIRANMIAPGPIEVPRNAPLFRSEAMAASFATHVPLGHAGRPEDIGNVAVFLAGEGSAFMTGSALTVDGGMFAMILPPPKRP